MMKYLPERFSALAKKELLYSPFGVAAWLAGLVFVDRLNKDKSRHTMDKTVDLLHRRNVPIIPVVLSSYRHFLSGKHKIFNSGEVIMAVLPPVSTEGLSSENVADLTEQIRCSMADVFEKITKRVEDKARENNNCELLDLIPKTS